MENEAKERAARQNEVSLVDLLVVMIRKRKLWFGITTAGTGIALLLLLLGKFAPGLMGVRQSYVETSRVIVLEEGIGPLLVDIAKSEACLKLVGKATNEGLAAAYAAGASVSFDPGSKILRISVASPSPTDADALVKAGFAAIEELSLDFSGERYGKLADSLDSTAKKMLPAKTDFSPFPADESIAAAATARAARIVAEANAGMLSPLANPDKIATMAFGSLISSYQASEKSGYDEALRKAGGERDRKAAERLEASVSALAAQKVFEAARLYRGIDSKPEERFSVLDTTTAAMKSGGFILSTKKFILIAIASLFMGILVAFIANAWDRIKEDPKAMERLREAKK